MQAFNINAICHSVSPQGAWVKVIPLQLLCLKQSTIVLVARCLGIGVFCMRITLLLCTIAV